MNVIRNNFPATIVLLVFVSFWEGIIRITDTPKYILPSPVHIITAFVKERQTILEHSYVTIYEALIGFLLAIGISLLLGLVIEYCSFFKRGFYPLLVISQTIPIIAVAPLFMIWFGYGILPKIIVVTLVAFFPIVISIVDGLQSTEEDLIDLLRTMNATKWHILVKVKFPSALPSIFSGLRIAATYSVMGAVIGEWLGASKGLGLYMRNTMNSFLTDQLFAAILVVIISSILFYKLLLVIERQLIPWKYKKIEDK